MLKSLKRGKKAMFVVLFTEKTLFIGKKQNKSSPLD